MVKIPNRPEFRFAVPSCEEMAELIKTEEEKTGQLVPDDFRDKIIERLRAEQYEKFKEEKKKRLEVAKQLQNEFMSS